ncbi:TrbI/VirB10 family protein [Sphingomonas hylomeconis]|nr:TrbI/VirB10 family protein [Sphingomonas hylomeconis]
MAPTGDVRPMVAAPPRRTPLWMIVGGFVAAGLLLFVLLDSRRRALTAPATQARGVDPDGRAAPPAATLFVPPVAASAPARVIVAPTALPTPAPRFVPPVFYPPPRAARSYEPPPIQMPPATEPVQPPATPARGGTVTAIVFDSTTADAVAATGGTGVMASVLGDRARASILRNGSTTVPQGTLIPAVLETALDSTRPGLARALVQRDVVGFDGTKVLIQRGSRLIGEYRADLQPGQNRASVLWTRLVRPDGVTIALGSQAADTLGRGGIKGSVNSHFLARFGAAILQSTLDVGVALASRAGNNNGVIIGSPLGGFGGGGLIGNNNQVRPTLTVKQGTALMVFVARDLDFSGVEGRR